MLRESMGLQDVASVFGGIVGGSEPMKQTFRHLQRVSETDSTVLISGESGTGKELVASAVHRTSARREGPYIAVNIAAIPENLLESELFGHVKGAYTDAAADRRGRFEAADCGTLFIDEIGDLKLPSQAKLLRVLESRRITPVGHNRPRPVDVRVIVATNRPLDAMVAEKRFREDLYYRLNVVNVTLPPLRERPEDVPLLVDHFLEEICQAYGRARPRLSAELQQFMARYHWPGNVRQLRNCVESMVVLGSSDVLTTDELPGMVRHNHSKPPRIEIPPSLTLEEVVRSTVLHRLRRCDGNRTQAARSLNISVRTLQRRLRRWGVVHEGHNHNGTSPAHVHEELAAGV